MEILDDAIVKVQVTNQLIEKLLKLIMELLKNKFRILSNIKSTW